MAYEVAGELKCCPSCAGTGVEHLGIIYDRFGVGPGQVIAFITGCEDCGLIFTNPPLSPGELDALYRQGGFWERKLEDRKTRKKPEIQLVQDDSGRLSFGAELTRLSGLGLRSVLDFGCGEGHLLDNLKRNGWETTGLDPVSSDQITQHRMIEKMPDEPTYDLIIFKHVLEHLIDPLTVLRQARRCLRENGRIYIGVPTLDDLTQHRRKEYCINRSHHMTGYTRRSLERLLSLAGFEVERYVKQKLLYRMGLIAQLAKAPVETPSPLVDARRELEEFARSTCDPETWKESVRERAEDANRSLSPMLAVREQKREERARRREEKEKQLES